MAGAQAAKPRKSADNRVHLRPSREVLAYLQELADQGILGSKRTAVAEALVVDGIRRLIREGLLHIKPKPAKAQLRVPEPESPESA